MNDNNEIDFSPLDPSRDELRWQQRIDTVVDRGMAARGRPPTVFYQLVIWSRPALATAALVAIVIWLGALASIWPLVEEAKASEDKQIAFVQWALGERSGSVWEDAARIGGENGEL